MWLPLLNGRRFAEFETSVFIYLVSFLLQDIGVLKQCFKALSIGSSGTMIKIFHEHILLTCILYCDPGPRRINKRMNVCFI